MELWNFQLLKLPYGQITEDGGNNEEKLKVLMIAPSGTNGYISVEIYKDYETFVPDAEYKIIGIGKGDENSN